MKRNFLILVLAFCLLAAYGQDMQRFAERSCIGTARYVGMGGAMTAIGGDPSAAMDNPAGLGLYRRSEISVSVDGTWDKTQQHESKQVLQRSRLTLPQVSAIWSSGDPNKQKGLIYSNLMFTMNRIHNYNRDLLVSGHNTGMLPTICTKTNGLPEGNLVNLPWDDEDIGWLSILGYEGYLINPTENNMWEPALKFTDGELKINEKGSSDQYTLSWAGNINNQWYIGASLNIPTINYTKYVSLVESDRKNSAELKSMFHVSGVGISASIGLLARPVEWLRIGASVQTPTELTLSLQTEGDMHSTVNGNKYEVLTPASGSISTTYASPMRTSISIAGQWKNIGMLALQYDYAHAFKDKEANVSPMQDIHTLKAGLEVHVNNSLFLNAGYVYESSFSKEDPVVALNYNSIRTDTDCRFTQSSQYASLGIGYRSHFLVAQVAYQFGWQEINQYATEHQADAFKLNTNTHRIVCTLAWRI